MKRLKKISVKTKFLIAKKHIVLTNLAIEKVKRLSNVATADIDTNVANFVEDDTLETGWTKVACAASSAKDLANTLWNISSFCDWETLR